MHPMRIFKNEEFGAIRTVEINGEPWFVAADVCRALDIQNHKDAIKRLDEDERMGVALTDPHGREQETNCVNEPGLYSLVLGSRKPEARAFKRWVTHEVIPSIRKNGMYAIDALLENPDLLIEAAPKLKAERQRRMQAEQERAALEEALDRSKEWYSIKRVAALNGVSWKTFDWRRLKAFGELQGCPVRKIFDANYGEVNVYHRSIWAMAYPEYEL